jgi:hypothetical protein
MKRGDVERSRDTPLRNQWYYDGIRFAHSRSLSLRPARPWRGFPSRSILYSAALPSE